MQHSNHANSGQERTSNKLMVIRVPREGFKAYQEIEYLDFAGKDIAQKLVEKETKNSMNEILIELIRADDNKVQTFSPHSYELYFAYALTNGLHWPARDLTNQPKTLFSKPFLPTRTCAWESSKVCSDETWSRLSIACL
jgi:hypothetical protein